MIKLRLLGYVADSKIPNTFFVDYNAGEEIFAGVEYMVRSINSELLPPGAVEQRLTIRRIRDQFGNVLSSISHGWKTICTIEFLFKNVLIEKLKRLDEWDYNAHAIDLELVSVD